jgi:hypothetical protein
MRRPVLLLLAALHCMAAPAMESVPKAVIADPPPDAKFPARMEVIHVPGNEKNLDLAQAVRRAGWTVITVTPSQA